VASAGCAAAAQAGGATAAVAAAAVAVATAGDGAPKSVAGCRTAGREAPVADGRSRRRTASRRRSLRSSPSSCPSNSTHRALKHTARTR